MASRKSTTPSGPPKPPSLLFPREEARAQIAQQIDRGKPFLDSRAPEGEDPAFEAWDDFNEELLARLFSDGTYKLGYQRTYYKVEGAGVMRVDFFGGGYQQSGPSIAQFARVKIQHLESLLQRLDLIPEAQQEFEIGAKASTKRTGPIFIVHGHDSPAKIEVARFVERAGLVATILHEQANSGRTIIEKFEAHGGAAGFAIIVATPDDVGGEKPESGKAPELKPRACQNVIIELGWFAGHLGRGHVCVLKKGEIDMPSDFAGVVYTEMDERGAWKAELARELEAVGYSFDWRSALA